MSHESYVLTTKSCARVRGTDTVRTLLMYRVIDGAFWTDPRVRKLAGSGKLLFLYLITNTHTHVSGIYYLPRVVVAHESGVPADDLDTLCDTLSAAGLAKFDRDRELVWVVNMFRYQGRGQKNAISASQHLKTLHDSPLCKDFAKNYPEVTKIKNGYKPNRVSIPIPSQGPQEQDQNQEKEQDQENPPTPQMGDGSQKPIEPSEAEPIEIHPVPKAIDTPRFRAAWARWREHQRALSNGRSMPLTTMQQQIDKLASWGEERAVAALEHSIGNGYRGLFEPSKSQQSKRVTGEEFKRRVQGGG